MNIDNVTLQDTIHYHFREVKLLEEALTHSSYANEQGLGEKHNERLEFLGDAVLELAVTGELYHRFSTCREGELTHMRSCLVSRQILATLAKQLKLDTALRLGQSETIQDGRGRHSILSNALEALLGAIFLDGGWEAARDWILEVLAERWQGVSKANQIKDCKSALQELTQKCYRARPMYIIENSFGPEHAKRFMVRLTMPTGEHVKASESSIKKAEQKAAGLALKRFGSALKSIALAK